MRPLTTYWWRAGLARPNFRSTRWWSPGSPAEAGKANQHGRTRHQLQGAWGGGLPTFAREQSLAGRGRGSGAPYRAVREPGVPGKLLA